MKHRALFLITTLFVMAMIYVVKDCKRFEAKNLNFESYIKNSYFSGKVLDIDTFAGIYRIKINDSDWFYPQYQINYLKTNLEIEDSIVKSKGKMVKIFKKKYKKIKAI